MEGYVELARREGCQLHCGHGLEELHLPEKNRDVSKRLSGPVRLGGGRRGGGGGRRGRGGRGGEARGEGWREEEGIA